MSGETERRDTERRDTEKRWGDTKTFLSASRYALVVIGVAILVMLLTVAWAATKREQCADAVFLVSAAPGR